MKLDTRRRVSIFVRNLSSPCLRRSSPLRPLLPPSLQPPFASPLVFLLPPTGSARHAQGREVHKKAGLITHDQRDSRLQLREPDNREDLLSLPLFFLLCCYTCPLRESQAVVSVAVYVCDYSDGEMEGETRKIGQQACKKEER